MEELLMELQEVKYGRNVKRVSLQRYLTSKVVYEKEKCTPQDILVLYDNQLWLENKVLRDRDFQNKFGNSLEELSRILKEVNWNSGLTSKAISQMSIRIRDRLEGFIIPRRNYGDFKKRFSGLFSVIPAKQPGVPKKALPPETYIGKGYGDKGTLKNPAQDGSPSWQEVASCAGQLALFERRVRDAKNFDELSRVFCDLFYIPEEARRAILRGDDQEIAKWIAWEESQQEGFKPKPTEE